jgi:hypothetical protein
MDNSYLYSTRIEKTYDEDLADIIARIRHELTLHKKIEIRLINYFKGLQVSYPAYIVGVDKETIELDVFPEQAVTMAIHHYTFIRSKLFKWDILANVQYVNIKKRAASLRKFSYVEIMAERRNYLRLELDEKIDCVLNVSEGVIQGRLVEISIKGACIQISHSCSLEIDNEVTMMFMLYNGGQDVSYNVKTHAKLVNIHGDALPRYYRFETFPDKICDRQISQFLFQRQVEIIRRIKDAAEI